MIIREASVADVKDLVSLEEGLFDKENFALSRRSFQYHIRNNLLLTAYSKDQLIGYALILLRKKSAKLYSIGVHEMQRGQGIGIKLMNTVCECVQSQGYKSMLLEVRVDNTTAITLYEKMGAIKLKQISSFYGDGSDAYLMEVQCAH